jgi:hypothetical protein
MIKKLQERNDFKWVRWWSNGNRFVQLMLIVGLLIGCNVLSFRYYTRKDLTANGRYSLSPETVAHLKQIKKQPINIVVIGAWHSTQAVVKTFYEDVRHLLKEFAYWSQKEADLPLTIEYVDVFLQRKRVDELVQQYGVQKENVVIVASGEKFHLLEAADFYISNRQKVVQFQGESILMQALLDVVSEKKVRVYFTDGHGEMDPFSADAVHGLSQVQECLTQRNLAVEKVNLLSSKTVPNDCDLLVIAGPRKAFVPEEEEVVRRFVEERQGHLLVLLNAMTQHGLDNVFFDCGILAENRVIVDPEVRNQTVHGDLIVKRYAPHPITQMLLDAQLPTLMGLCRPISVDIGANAVAGRSIVPLLYTTDTSFAKKRYRALGTTLTFDPEVDIKGPLPLVVLSEKTTSNKLGLAIPGERILVFGNAQFIGNRQIGALGNKLLLLNSIHWLLEEVYPFHVAPKSLTVFQMQVSKRDLLLAGTHLLILPLILGMMGIIVCFLRRR